MKRLFALLALALVLLAGCTQYSQPPASNGTGSGNNSTTVQAGTQTVSMSGFAFKPAALTIAAGTTVRWTNHDPSPHTITSDDGTSFSSGTLSQGAAFEHTFGVPGTYAYHCSIHPGMQGTIIVQ